MCHRIVPFVLVTLNFLCAFTRSDTVIHCNIKESCILPCRFQVSDIEVIHWIHEKTATSAHSYYHKNDQLMNQGSQFKGRTSLFLDEISKGNVSLQLRVVRVQDEGRYKCYASTITGQDETYVQLNVDAPVDKIDIHRTGNTITCSSEGIYPEPILTWSTEPSAVSHQGNTTVRPTEQKLYDITSSLNVSSSDLNVSCVVQTHKYKKKITLTKPSVQDSVEDTNLSCTLPALPRTNLIWRFNQNEEILRQDSNKTPKVSSEWEEYFVDLSALGMLTLKDLSEKKSGCYTCEARNSEETLISDTLLTVNKKPETSKDHRGTIIGVVIGVIATVGILALVFYFWYKRSNNKGSYWTGDRNEVMELRS